MKYHLTGTLSLLVLLMSSGTVHSQSGDGLDFLDKVENIQIPKETPEQKTAPTGTTSTKTTTSTPSSNTKSDTTTKTTTTVAPTKTTTTTKKVTPKTTTKTTVAPKPTPTKQLTTTTTSPTPAPTPTKTAPIEEEIQSPDTASQIWIDAPLAMDPDYLPGFTASKVELVDSTEKVKEEESTSKLKDFSRPLPTLSGNYSIWGSFVEFLSTYQKAFYIFGILLLFALYRLKSGRSSSSSRKSTPTIRRMRR